MIIYNRLRLMPKTVRSFCYSNNAWIVGSRAAWLLGLTERQADWDILVPLHEWVRAGKTIPPGNNTNSQGGVKLLCGGEEIDVWPGDIGMYLAATPEGEAYAVHPATYTWLKADRGYKK